MKRLLIVAFCAFAMAIASASAGEVPADVMQRRRKRIATRHPDN